MGWGNRLRDGDVARLKRHHAELQKRDRQIAELEAHRDRLLARVPHPNACGYWRGQPCGCGVGA
jgi:hypothetical protein